MISSVNFKNRFFIIATFMLANFVFLYSLENEKDLVVIIDSSLPFRDHIDKTTKLANSMAAIIKKGFLNITEFS